MIKTFKEVSEVKTVDFGSLAAGDYFCFNNMYYMKLLMEYELVDDDDHYYNSIDLESGALVSFCSGVRVKLYKTVR